MAGEDNEKGFTFYSLLLILTFTIICIHIYGAVLKTFREELYYDEISIQQLFHFIQHDVNQAIEVYIEDNKIRMTTVTGDLISIDGFRNVIRRQVNDLGHEIYVRNILHFECHPLPFGFNVTITSSKGDTYEKTIVFLKK